MSAATEERDERVAAIKHTLLTLADEHRERCDDDCTISLMWIGVVFDMANIGVTEEEARRLM